MTTVAYPDATFKTDAGAAADAALLSVYRLDATGIDNLKSGL
jgi:hypothetical protein